MHREVGPCSLRLGGEEGLVNIVIVISPALSNVTILSLLHA